MYFRELRLPALQLRGVGRAFVLPGIHWTIQKLARHLAGQMMLFSRIVVLLGAGAASLFVAACDHHRPRAPALPRAPLREVVQLDCPQREGVLRLVKVSDDGRICDYVGRAGEEVRLRIVPLDGQTPDIALAPLEAELKAYLPRREPSDPEALAAGDEDTADGASDRANISLPGINIDADDDSANIQIGGLTINANDDAANIRIDRRSESERRVIIEGEQVPAEASKAPVAPATKTADAPAAGEDGAEPVVRRRSARGDVSIDADERGAEIRIYAPGRSVRITYILASNEAGPAGYRVVGYVARGPNRGPLVVASIKAKSDNHDELLRPIERLLRRNLGG